MTETKYRFWDKENKSMIYDSDFLNVNSYGDVIYIDWDNDIVDKLSNHVKPCPKVIPLLSSGVKDKNDKDIYNEDIIKIPNSKMYSKVFFEAGCFMIENLSETCIKIRGKFEKVSNNPLSQEVVGNIRQNPELLIEEENNGTQI